MFQHACSNTFYVFKHPIKIRAALHKFTVTIRSNTIFHQFRPMERIALRNQINSHKLTKLIQMKFMKILLLSKNRSIVISAEIFCHILPNSHLQGNVEDAQWKILLYFSQLGFYAICVSNTAQTICINAKMIKSR